MRTDRTRTQPWGLAGGQPGAFSKTSVVLSGKERVIGKETLQLKRGDILRVQVAGAGGWGNPLERDVKMVENDVLNQKVSLERAKAAYGVVFNSQAMEVDKPTTKKLRDRLLPKSLNTDGR